MLVLRRLVWQAKLVMGESIVAVLEETFGLGNKATSCKSACVYGDK